MLLPTRPAGRQRIGNIGHGTAVQSEIEICHPVGKRYC